MEDQLTVPITVTFEQQTNSNKDASDSNTKPDAVLRKNYSEPKFRSYKQQILKIPKVKQILNKDKYVYSQDIEKRLELIGSLKSDHFNKEELGDLNDLRKNVDKSDKKNKRHKTNFKIPLTRKNMQSLNTLLVEHINSNQKFKNEEVVFLKDYQQNAPYSLEQLKFMDKLDQVKMKFSEKYPGINQRVLSKNRLTLENVILNRNIKREIKLDKKKQQKVHSMKVFNKVTGNSKLKQSAKNN